jgi:hypothetical protein
MPKIALLPLLILLPFVARAAVPEIDTDRPDQTESSALVPPSTFQLEAGAVGSHDQDVDTLEAPGTLLRYGLLPRLELRLAWGGLVRQEAGPSSDTGTADAELGAKVGLAPDLALIAHLSLPVGDEEVGSPRADPAIRVTASHTLTERLGLGWNAGWEAASSTDDAGGTHTLSRWVYTAALGVELGEAWGAFVEVFGDVGASDPGPPAHSLDGGVTYLLRPRVQLDLSAGVGLSDAAPDRFVGLGVSFRLPR